MCSNPSNCSRSGAVQYVPAVSASVDASHVASVASSGWSEACAHRPSPFQAVTASDDDSWLFPSANGDVPDAHEWPAYGSNDRSCGSSSDGWRRRDVLREQVHHGCELGRECRVVLREQARRGQEVPVVEVVVVELVRAEGRREADGRAGRLVVHEAPGVACGAPVGLGPLPEGVDGRRPQVGHDVRHAQLLAQHDERRRAVERLAPEVGVGRERRGGRDVGLERVDDRRALVVGDAVQVQLPGRPAAPGANDVSCDPAHSSRSP